MDLAPSTHNKKIHLQLGSEKFFDVIIDKETFQAIVIEGELIDGQKAINKARKNVQQNPSYLMAEDYVLELVNNKLDEGFELISEKGWNDESQLSEIAEEDSPIIPNNIKDFFDEIDKKNNDVELVEKADHGRVQPMKEDLSIDEISEINVIAERRKIERRIKEEEEEKKYNEEGSHGPFIQKELKLSGYMKTHCDKIQEQAERLNLIYEDADDKMLVAGPQEYMVDFLAWLYVQTVEKMENQINLLKQVNIEKKNNDYQQIEVTFSTFHRLHQDEIFAKADKLELICDFAYDVVLVSGYLENLKEFKSYLHDVETTAKKSLYPKYWDFHNIEKFAEINVPQGTEEFQEVEALFVKSLNNMRITKLTRIQNKYLMDNFITMLQKRQEFRSDEINISRRLLFHGSRQINPQTIYKDSDTGFDLQYSNAGGSCGKGLYFAIHSSYSHGYTYNLNNGSYQMFLADVFIGKSTRNVSASGLLKAPAGFDSVESADSFFVIYNNFHSYPLYLIEYTANNGVVPLNNVGNVNVMNNNLVGHSNMMIRPVNQRGKLYPRNGQNHPRGLQLKPGYQLQ